MSDIRRMPGRAIIAGNTTLIQGRQVVLPFGWGFTRIAPGDHDRILILTATKTHHLNRQSGHEMVAQLVGYGYEPFYFSGLLAGTKIVTETVRR